MKPLSIHHKSAADGAAGSMQSAWRKCAARPSTGLDTAILQADCSNRLDGQVSDCQVDCFQHGGELELICVILNACLKFDTFTKIIGKAQPAEIDRLDLETGRGRFEAEIQGSTRLAKG
jgi:hypothetical protein